MKKIIALVIVLFSAIIVMAYFYFSTLTNKERRIDTALYTISANSPVVFALQNDTGIFEILKGQALLGDMLSKDRRKEFQSIKRYIIDTPIRSQFSDQNNLYIGFIPGNDKNIDFLITSNIKSDSFSKQVADLLKSNKIDLDSLSGTTKLTLPDSSTFYIAIKQHVLLLSNTDQILIRALGSNTNKENSFSRFIASNSKLEKNSLAELYINYNALPKIIQKTIPGRLTGKLSVLDRQNSFAALVYNFSLEKVLFNGTTQINEEHSYLELFNGVVSEKFPINNLLPQNTSNYVLYSIDHYQDWKRRLNKWFSKKKSEPVNITFEENIKKKYHLDLEKIFFKYFKNQLLEFQLSTTEKLGAINLTNGDKFSQLLIEISQNYDEEIRSFKESGLLYYYFGEPFENFKRPYYTIIDNYLVFANNPSTVRSFLASYKNNKMLINDINYSHTINQLPSSSSITFYVNFENSSRIFLRNVYLPYYRHLFGEEGMKDYTSFIYQMTYESGRFQTNMLFNRKESNHMDLPPSNSSKQQ